MLGSQRYQRQFLPLVVVLVLQLVEVLYSLRRVGNSEWMVSQGLFILLGKREREDKVWKRNFCLRITSVACLISHIFVLCLWLISDHFTFYRNSTAYRHESDSDDSSSNGGGGTSSMNHNEEEEGEYQVQFGLNYSDMNLNNMNMIDPSIVFSNQNGKVGIKKSTPWSLTLLYLTVWLYFFSLVWCQFFKHMVLSKLLNICAFQIGQLGSSLKPSSSLMNDDLYESLTCLWNQYRQTPVPLAANDSLVAQGTLKKRSAIGDAYQNQHHHQSDEQRNPGLLSPDGYTQLIDEEEMKEETEEKECNHINNDNHNIILAAHHSPSMDQSQLSSEQPVPSAVGNTATNNAVVSLQSEMLKNSSSLSSSSSISFGQLISRSLNAIWDQVWVKSTRFNRAHLYLSSVVLFAFFVNCLVPLTVTGSEDGLALRWCVNSMMLIQLALILEFLVTGVECLYVLQKIQMVYGGRNKEMSVLLLSSGTNNALRNPSQSVTNRYHTTTVSSAIPQSSASSSSALALDDWSEAPSSKEISVVAPLQSHAVSLPRDPYGPSSVESIGGVGGQSTHPLQLTGFGDGRSSESSIERDSENYLESPMTDTYKSSAGSAGMMGPSYMSFDDRRSVAHSTDVAGPATNDNTLVSLRSATASISGFVRRMDYGSKRQNSEQSDSEMMDYRTRDSIIAEQKREHLRRKRMGMELNKNGRRMKGGVSSLENGAEYKHAVAKKMLVCLVMMSLVYVSVVILNLCLWAMFYERSMNKASQDGTGDLASVLYRKLVINRDLQADELSHITMFRTMDIIVVTLLFTHMYVVVEMYLRLHRGTDDKHPLMSHVTVAPMYIGGGHGANQQ